MTDPGPHAQLTHEVTELTPYTATVGTKTHGGRTRPIRRTRYFVRCSCGWEIAGADWINAVRLWRTHRGGAL